jgi:hypothetical protein
VIFTEAGALSFDSFARLDATDAPDIENGRSWRVLTDNYSLTNIDIRH